VCLRASPGGGPLGETATSQELCPALVAEALGGCDGDRPALQRRGSFDDWESTICAYRPCLSMTRHFSPFCCAPEEISASPAPPSLARTCGNETPRLCGGIPSPDRYPRHGLHRSCSTTHAVPSDRSLSAWGDFLARELFSNEGHEDPVPTVSAHDVFCRQSDGPAGNVGIAADACDCRCSGGRHGYGLSSTLPANRSNSDANRWLEAAPVAEWLCGGRATGGCWVGVRPLGGFSGSFSLGEFQFDGKRR
jgi:hypothetical protein